MSLILIDGCDDRSSGNLGTQAGSLANGRTGKGAAAYASFAIPAALQSDTITIGFAVCPTVADAPYIVQFTGTGGIDNRLQIQTTGAMRFYRNGTTMLVSSAGLVTTNVWIYVEWQMRVHDTLGMSTVRINGTVVPSLTATGLDTKFSTGTLVDTVAGMTPGVSASPHGIDDIYLMTGAGDAFLGDCVVETLYPDGNGTVNTWVGSDGNSTDNYLLVDETPLVAADYTGSSTSGAQDLYTFQNLALTGEIYAVQHAVVGINSDATARQFKIVNHGSVDTKSSAFNVTTTAAESRYTLMTNPETGLAWKSGAVNALQAGVEVV